jgi:uncharacterized protein
VDITSSFELPLDPDSAWNTLLDIKRIMPCIPGAELLEARGDGSSYKGKVSVRLGPVALAFVGTAVFTERDAAARRAHLRAQGNDSKGRGGVQADMIFQVAQAGDGSRVAVLTQVTFTGAVAQYGRGTGIIQGVASQLIAQFAANLKVRLAESERAASQPAPPAEPGPPATGALRESNGPAALQAAAGEQRATPHRPPPQTAAAKPISGFALLLKVLWGRFIDLFARRV